MSRNWGGYGACLAGICLWVMSGCAPTGQMTKVADGHEPPPAAATAEKSAGADTAAQSQQTKAAGQESPSLPTKAPEPNGYHLSGDDPLVGERIALFEKKKGEWYGTGSQLAELKTADAWPDSWQECLQDVELALNGYRELQAGRGQDQNPWTIVGRDVHYYDHGCDQVLALAQAKLSTAPPAAAPPPAAPVAVADDQLRRDYEAGHYQEAVTVYEALAASQQASARPREEREYYSRALIKLGRWQEAARLMTELLQEPNPHADLAAMEFKLLTADVLLATGQVNEAREVYAGVAKTLEPIVSQQAWAASHAQAFAEEVSAEDLALYQELLQAYLAFDGQQVPQLLIDGVSHLQGKPPGPLLDLARVLLTKTQAQAQAWARSQLAEVRNLIDRHELGPARELVERVATAAPPEMHETISALQQEIARAEATAPPVPTQETAPVDPWAEANHLVEQQRYDEAIAAFQQLADGVHGAEAKAKIAEIAEVAASSLRRQAAALYAKASKTFDPESKRQILQSSRALLLELIDKYPETSVVAKARQNLKVLDTALGQGQPGAPEPPAADMDATKQ